MDGHLLLNALLPDLVLVVGLFACLTVDYTWLRGRDVAARHAVVSRVAAWTLIAGLLAGILGARDSQLLNLNFGDGQLVFTPARLLFKFTAYLLALMIVELFANSRPAPAGHVSEHYALLLLSTLGIGFITTSGHLLSAFVGLELLSLCLYAMAALDKHRRAGAEAALKYFAIGGLSSAFLLFGLSYLYGVTGELEIAKIAQHIHTQTTLSPLLGVAFLFILVGLGFKLAVVPFHLWAPDVYQNAPTAVAAWVATGSKLGSTVLLVSLLGPAFDTATRTASPAARPLALALATLAVVSMLVGNLGALRQSNLKRLLAYGSIASAGYLLVGLVVFSDAGRTAVYFYVLTYALASLGAFAVVALVSDQLGRDAEIADFRGCWRTMPGVALAFMIFLLSLASIPPLSGFIGKFALFFAAIQHTPTAAAWHEGWYWLVAFALVMSVVGLYYYLKVLRAFLVADGESAMPPVRIGTNAAVMLVVLAILVVALGVWPEPLLQFLRN